MRGRVRAQEVVQERAGQQEQQAGRAPGAAPWSVGGQEVFGVTAARRLEGEAVQGPEDAPAEVAAAEGPGAMLQGTAFTAPLVMLAVAAGEVGRAHAEAAQHAGAAVPAAARPRGRTLSESPGVGEGLLWSPALGAPSHLPGMTGGPVER